MKCQMKITHAQLYDAIRENQPQRELEREGDIESICLDCFRDRAIDGWRRRETAHRNFETDERRERIDSCVYACERKHHILNGMPILMIDTYHT